MDWEDHKEVFINFWVKVMLPIAGMCIVIYWVGKWAAPYLPENTGRWIGMLISFIGALGMPAHMWVQKRERAEHYRKIEAEHQAKVDAHNKETHEFKRD